MIKRRSFSFLLAALVTGTTAHGQAHSPHAPSIPAAEQVPLFDNLGRHHHAVTTTSRRAQQFFDQGLRLIFAFNHDEAIRAFSEAARLDPNCAMAYWGIGFAHGPNYNLPLDDERNRAAVAATQKAVALASGGTPREQAYIAALARRYSLEPGADRKSLDVAFADAMRLVAQQYADDLDAATLFAEAMMDLRPWDLWTLDGQPQPGTLEIVATLERVLRKDPNHPGANHYFVHAIEASNRPDRGLPSARRLQTLVPGAGHLVHMPSHIYMRVGRYADATEANRRAVAVDRQYLAVAKPSGVYPMMYYPHNITFLQAAATMEGRSADAIAAAREVAAMLTPEMVREMPMVEAFTPSVYFAFVRFGRWEEMLREAEPATDLRYTAALWHYGRGFALVRTGRPEEAAAELTQLQTVAAEVPQDRIIGDNTPAAMNLGIAQEILAGELAARNGRIDDAERHLAHAVELQDRLPYTEPPPWYYPVRQSLGAVLLAADRPRDAESVFRADLARNPENGWSLFGLERSLKAQGKSAQAARVGKRFRRAWARADVALSASRF